MRFFVVAVLAVLASGAEAGIITMSEDLSLGGPFFPTAIDEKGELIYFDMTDIGGGGAVWSPAPTAPCIPAAPGIWLFGSL